MIFGNRHLLGLAISRASGGEDKVIHRAILHRIQEIESAPQIRLVVEFRLFHGLTNKRFAGKMQDALDPVSGKHTRKVLGIADISLDGGRSFDERMMACREVVEDQRLKPGMLECFNRVTSDIAGSAGDQDHV